jgi:protein-tyrosine-phosphatase
MTPRIFFLCAQGSSRALLAASLLQAQEARSWEAWSTPSRDERGNSLVRQVLKEQSIPLLSPNRVIQPAFGMHWDEGVVLCSGGAAT